MSSELKIIATDDFELVSRRLELLAKSTNARELIDAEIAVAYHQLLTGRKTELGQLNGRIEFAEKIILAIALEHPEWFADRKTLSTPFGSVHAQSTTRHKAVDEQHSVRLIKAAADRTEDPLQRARLIGLIRVKEELNLEAIEGLSDKELRPLRIARIKGVSLTIKLAKPGAKKAGRAKKQTADEKEKVAA